MRVMMAKNCTFNSLFYYFAYSFECNHASIYMVYSDFYQSLWSIWYAFLKNANQIVKFKKIIHCLDYNVSFFMLKIINIEENNHYHRCVQILIDIDYIREILTLDKTRV